jgi:hypothetical protein
VSEPADVEPADAEPANGDDTEPVAPGAPELPEGVLAVRFGPGANCSSAGSAIDVLFYGSVLVGAIAVALAAAFPPREPPDEGNGEPGSRDAPTPPGPGRAVGDENEPNA